MRIDLCLCIRIGSFSTSQFISLSFRFSGCKKDYYSLGVMLYVMVFGESPFQERLPLIQQLKIHQGNIEYPKWIESLMEEGVSGEIQSEIQSLMRVMKRLLAKNPEERSFDFEEAFLK